MTDAKVDAAGYPLETGGRNTLWLPVPPTRAGHEAFGTLNAPRHGTVRQQTRIVHSADIKEPVIETLHKHRYPVSEGVLATMREQFNYMSCIMLVRRADELPIPLPVHSKF